MRQIERHDLRSNCIYPSPVKLYSSGKTTIIQNDDSCLINGIQDSQFTQSVCLKAPQYSSQKAEDIPQLSIVLIIHMQSHLSISFYLIFAKGAIIATKIIKPKHCLCLPARAGLQVSDSQPRFLLFILSNRPPYRRIHVSGFFIGRSYHQQYPIFRIIIPGYPFAQCHPDHRLSAQKFQYSRSIKDVFLFI